MVLLLVIISALIFAGSTIICYYRPLWGLSAIIFLLPFERIGSYSLNPAAGHPVIRLVQLVAAAFIVAGGLKVISGQLKLKFPQSWRYLLFFSGSALLSAIFINYFRVWQIYGWLIFVVALFLLALQYINAQTIKSLGKSLFASATVVSGFGLFQFIGDLAGLPLAITGLEARYSKLLFGFPRIQSTSFEPLYFASYLLLPVLVGVALLLTQKHKITMKQGIMAIIIGLAFLLTSSRGAYAGLAVGLLVLAISLRKELRNWLKQNARALVVGLISVAVLGTLAVASASLVSFGDITTGPRNFIELTVTKVLQGGSFTERVASYASGLAAFMAHPLLGVGLGGYASWIYGYPVSRAGYDWIIINNHTIQLLAETGVVGLSLYGLFIFQLLRGAFSKAKAPEVRGYVLGAAAALIAMLVQYQTFSGFFITHIWITLALIAGLIL